MKPSIRHSEHGFSLLIGMSVLILLTVLGVAIVQSISADVDAAGSDRGAQSALAIAEAGLTWSLDYLNRTYGLGQATAATFNDIASNTGGDLSVYAEASAEEKLPYDAETPANPTKWKLVTHNRASAEKNFGGGRYIVWVGLDPADPGGKTLLLRSLGIDARGARRLIEIAVTAGAAQAP